MRGLLLALAAHAACAYTAGALQPGNDGKLLETMTEPLQVRRAASHGCVHRTPDHKKPLHTSTRSHTRDPRPRLEHAYARAHANGSSIPTHRGAVDVLVASIFFDQRAKRHRDADGHLTGELEVVSTGALEVVSQRPLTVLGRALYVLASGPLNAVEWGAALKVEPSPLALFGVALFIDPPLGVCADTAALPPSRARFSTPAVLTPQLAQPLLRLCLQVETVDALKALASREDRFEASILRKLDQLLGADHSEVSASPTPSRMRQG